LSYSPTPKSLAKNSTKLNHLRASDNLTRHDIINRHTNYRFAPKRNPAWEKGINPGCYCLPILQFLETLKNKIALPKVCRH